MQVDQLSWTESTGRRSGSEHGGDSILFFGTRDAPARGARYRALRAMFPAAHILGCSTGGRIRPHVPRVGFHPDGEICPHSAAGLSKLHNQTMTVTAIAEHTG
jgi:hypothetical protein